MFKNRGFWEGPSDLYYLWLLALAAAGNVELVWATMGGDPPATDPLRDFLDKAYFGGRLDGAAALTLADRLQELIPAVSANKLNAGLKRLPSSNRWRRDCEIPEDAEEEITQTLRSRTTWFVGALRSAGNRGEAIEWRSPGDW